ncbi:xanthine phosphoribosyltransferase [Collibacillus ludicampi]|uniref:Xanthine phosphoribosyltransferase n=1 Tax=Collibacillus ludicampi TaxID=2771369 RepID=A0AAV4LFV9_9BACL|nr:xanthine phosphoribosyltransferase [Collibacillus ludicampi]
MSSGNSEGKDPAGRIVVSDAVLKIDSFLNQQVDPDLMNEIGREFAARFASESITKVLTIESSGIAPALMTAMRLRVPMIFARKKKSITMQGDLYAAPVYSYTKQEVNEVTVAKKFLSVNDRVLIIDDILANGAAALGLAQIVEQAQAKVAGIGIVLEKSFQEGASKLKEAGYRVESLVKVASLQNQQIRFLEDVPVKG